MKEEQGTDRAVRQRQSTCPEDVFSARGQQTTSFMKNR